MRCQSRDKESSEKEWRGIIMLVSFELNYRLRNRIFIVTRLASQFCNFVNFFSIWCYSRKLVKRSLLKKTSGAFLSI